jgi:hypothetical protein
MSSVPPQDQPSSSSAAGAAFEEEQDDVMLLPSPGFEIVPFAVSVPASSTMETIAFEDDYESDHELQQQQQEEEEEDCLAAAPKKKKVPQKPPHVVNDSSMDGMGIVGTITVLKTSFIIWFGWGKIEPNDKDDSTRIGVNHSRTLGHVPHPSEATCRMGQLLIAMPPRHYPGALGASSTMTDALESSTSKLIGSDYDDDMIARPMACRLSQKTSKPVLVSCNLDASHIQSMGLDPDVLHARAAALAEQQIWSILQRYNTL